MPQQSVNQCLFRAWLSLAAALLVGTGYAESQAASATAGDLDRLAKAYHIEIVSANPTFPIKTKYGEIAGRRAEKSELEEYVALFVFEFGLYPPDLVKRAQLERVVLCKELAYAGQRRNAIPDFEHNTLYLDVSRGAYSKRYLRKVIHHEFFHIIDLRDDGLLYQDQRWESLNPANFKYGRGGRNAQDIAETSLLTDKFPGFLNHYSTTGVEEDKAEVFANMMVEPAYLEDRIKHDRILKAKVDRMKELLLAFCGDMNDAFWKKVLNVKRPDK